LKAGETADDSAAFVATAELSLKQQQKTYSEIQRVAVGAGLSAEKLNLAKARVQYAASRLALAKGFAEQPPEVRRRWEIELLIDELESIREAVGKLKAAD
jgi:hypothetical protein